MKRRYDPYSAERPFRVTPRIFLASLAAIVGIVASIWFFTTKNNSMPITIPQPEGYSDLDFDLAQAIKESVDACATHKKEDDFVRLGNVYLANEMFELATESYQLVSAENTDAKSKYRLGYSYYRMGKLSESIKWFHGAVEDAQKENNRHAPLFWRLSIAKADAGDGKEAVELAKKAIEMAPADSQARLVLARAYLETDQAEAAIRELDEVGKQDHENKPFETFLRNNALRQLKRSSEVKDAQIGLKVAPNWTDDWISELSLLAKGQTAKRIRAGRLFRAKKFPEAIEILESLLKNDSREKLADEKMLLACYLLTGNHEKSLPLLQSQIEVYPEDSSLRMSLAEGAMKLSFSKTDVYYKLAESTLRETTEKFPDRWEPLDALGQLKLLWQKEPNREALEWFDRACKLAPIPASCHVNRLNLLLALQEFELAEQHISKFPNELQKDPYLLATRGRAQIGLKNFPQARLIVDDLKKGFGKNEFWKNEIAEQEKLISAGLAKPE